MKLKVFPVLFAVILFVSRVCAAPIITSFSPIFGASNDMAFIYIYGSGFNPGLGGTISVKFNGVESVPPAYNMFTDGTRIQAHVAPGTPLGPGRIVVKINNDSTQSGNLFTVIGPGPFITNFTPVIGGAGTVVTIQGVHFFNGSASLQVTNVKFNGISGTGLFVNSDNQVTVNAPAGVSTGPITVTCALGTFSSLSNIVTSATNFFVRPAITAFSPAAGRSGTNVVITGSNFLYTSSVSFGSTPASFTPPTNNSTLRVVVPAGASTGPITVNNPVNNPFTTSSNFVIRPTISGFSPGFGPVGTSVTVNGANFNASGLSVKFGGVSAPAPTGVTFGSLTVTVPAGATNAPITVTTVDGSDTSAQLFYLPAQITSITPTNSAPGTFVTLTGSNFIGATSVTFLGTAPVPVINTTNNTTLRVAVPAGVITGPISVTTPAGTADSGGKFFYGAPVVNSFIPTHGLPNTNVTILGTNFLAAQFVRFNGVNAPSLTVVNNGQINTAVPNGATTGPITVIGPAGTNTSAGVFTLDSADLAVTLADAPDPVFIGSNLVYTITVANSGAFDVSNVTLTNTLPGSVNLLSATASQGTLNTNANPIRGTLGTVASGGAAVVTLTVAPQIPGTITNLARVGGGIPDSSLANNSNSIATLVWPLPSLSIAWLTNQVQLFWPGSLSNFTLQFQNGLSPAYHWSNDPVAPILSNGSNVVTEPRTNNSRFYRLKQ